MVVRNLAAFLKLRTPGPQRLRRVVHESLGPHVSHGPSLTRVTTRFSSHDDLIRTLPLTPNKASGSTARTKKVTSGEVIHSGCDGTDSQASNVRSSAWHHFVAQLNVEVSVVVLRLCVKSISQTRLLG